MLRAVGNYLDSAGFCDITISVVEDGLLLAGLVLTPTDAGASRTMASYLFTVEDLDTSLRAAYTRRGSPVAPHAPESLRYEDILRVIGAHADAEGWRHIGVFQTPGKIHVKGYLDARLVSSSFTDEELRARITELAHRRPLSAPVEQVRRRWRLL
jgi:hypothetical protein